MVGQIFAMLNPLGCQMDICSSFLKLGLLIKKIRKEFDI